MARKRGDPNADEDVDPAEIGLDAVADSDVGGRASAGDSLRAGLSRNSSRWSVPRAREAVSPDGARHPGWLNNSEITPKKPMINNCRERSSAWNVRLSQLWRADESQRRDDETARVRLLSLSQHPDRLETRTSPNHVTMLPAPGSSGRPDRLPAIARPTGPVSVRAPRAARGSRRSRPPPHARSASRRST